MIKLKQIFKGYELGDDVTSALQTYNHLNVRSLIKRKIIRQSEKTIRVNDQDEQPVTVPVLVLRRKPWERKAKKE